MVGTSLDPGRRVRGRPARPQRGGGRHQCNSATGELEDRWLRRVGGSLADTGKAHAQLAQRLEVAAQPLDAEVEDVIAGRREQVEANGQQVLPTPRRGGDVDADPRSRRAAKVVQQDVELREGDIGAPDKLDEPVARTVIGGVRAHDHCVAGKGDLQRLVVQVATCTQTLRIQTARRTRVSGRIHAAGCHNIVATARADTPAPAIPSQAIQSGSTSEAKIPNEFAPRKTATAST
jgi:hypothetical protein